ncbi:FAD-dependent oxidoreductase [Brumimicrobium aurantiacum]|uniref:FAD-dependent oxidoreductase n=1 Tax=Brumimicrobium aurantiacum TaxID=1737063 RepID=UPI00374413F8
MSIHEKEIASLKHKNGQLEHLTFKDNSTVELKAIYARPDFEEHCKIPETLGCEFTEQGHIKVDMFQKTSEEGVFAIGDSTTPFRSVANAISAGNIAGAVLNNAMIEEEFRL